MSVFGPLIWSMDPFMNDRKELRRILGVIRKWKFLFRNIQSVSIVYPIDVGWMDIDTEYNKAAAESEAKDYLAKLFKPKKDIFFKQSVVCSKTSSRLQSADLIVDAAINEGAGAILLGSHAKPNQKTGMGSYAEVLIGKSPIPILIAGPKVVSNQSKKILFPTDFSKSSEYAFDKILKIAKEAGATVALYHRIDLSNASSYISFIPGGLPEWVAEMWWDQRQVAEKRAMEWVKKAAKIDVFCEICIENEFSSFSESICEYSDKINAGLIAFGVRRRLWRQIFLGGDLRGVFAKAHVPILIFHAKKSK